MLVFEEMGKSEYPKKNLLEQGRESTTSLHPTKLVYFICMLKISVFIYAHIIYIYMYHPIKHRWDAQTQGLMDPWDERNLLVYLI